MLRCMRNILMDRKYDQKLLINRPESFCHQILLLPLQEYFKKYTEPNIKLLQNYHAHLLSQMFKGFTTPHPPQVLLTFPSVLKLQEII